MPNLSTGRNEVAYSKPKVPRQNADSLHGIHNGRDEEHDEGGEEKSVGWVGPFI
jgi:hypothetical protein